MPDTYLRAKTTLALKAQEICLQHLREGGGTRELEVGRVSNWLKGAEVAAPSLEACEDLAVALGEVVEEKAAAKSVASSSSSSSSSSELVVPSEDEEDESFVETRFLLNPKTYVLHRDRGDGGTCCGAQAKIDLKEVDASEPIPKGALACKNGACFGKPKVGPDGQVCQGFCNRMTNLPSGRVGRCRLRCSLGVHDGHHFCSMHPPPQKPEAD